MTKKKLLILPHYHLICSSQPPSLCQGHEYIPSDSDQETLSPLSLLLQIHIFGKVDSKCQRLHITTSPSPQDQLLPELVGHLVGDADSWRTAPSETFYGFLQIIRSLAVIS